MWPAFFIALMIASSSLSAEELTKDQCASVGGTHTPAGCLMLTDREKSDLKYPNVYTPGAAECSRRGGKWHKEYGCMAPMSLEQCKSLGGEMQEGVGCVQKMSEEQCTALGGVLDEKGGCRVKPQPNSSIESGSPTASAHLKR